MSKTIPILVAVDAERILQDHQPNGYNPVSLKNDGRGYAFLMSCWANVDRYQDINMDRYLTGAQGLQDQQEGGYGLNVKAEAGDIIQWRAVCLSSPFQYRCYIHSFTLVNNWTWKNIAPPKPQIKKATYAAVTPASTTPRRVAPVTAEDYWWESVVVSTDRQPYNMQYAIIDSDGTHRGVFSHDPDIT